MSDISNYKRLKKILEYIDNIDMIIKRHDDMNSALTDMEGQAAILMYIMQIGELINKISSDSIKNVLPVKESYSVRNFIAHNYDGVNIDVIEKIITDDLPNIIISIKSIINN